ncbi:phage holin [Peribacillus muralis]|uniref:Phage holin n=1 Tax=Peribacillus muralis TaxID=264697 RepID=A0A1B3XMS4_9BACI|nr:phage holin [Peribacillus muralis]AOH54503.1 phage holin [Peribacillus muralis]
MINWKVRFKNPLFITQLFLAVFVPILGYFGLTAQDLTTWGSVYNLLVDSLSNPYVVVIMVISLWNAINDPTTKGVKDSPSAMNYNEPK